MKSFLLAFRLFFALLFLLLTFREMTRPVGSPEESPLERIIFSALYGFVAVSNLAATIELLHQRFQKP